MQIKNDLLAEPESTFLISQAPSNIWQDFPHHRKTDFKIIFWIHICGQQ